MSPLLKLLLLCSVALVSPVQAQIADSAQVVRPILVGSAAPSVQLTRLSGASTTLAAELGGKPTVLVFYRGGWCPYCNLQLSELRKLGPDLATHGFQLLAISPDRAEELGKTLKKGDIDFALVSDSHAEALQAFGIAFRVDDSTVEKYQGFGIDLEHASGETHHILPVPSVFVIDAAGVIQFAYVNPDYRTRVPLRMVRAAIEAVALGEAGRLLKPAR
ncbi:MAG: AhpC/TSA family protein [Rhodanobacteraceae bacterium]|nr:AhpC/TSA family protein [Rhodanobacteraceae bacterium]